MIREAKLDQLLLNLPFFVLSEFHAIPIRFNPPNTFGGLRGRIHPVTKKKCDHKKDRDWQHDRCPEDTNARREKKNGDVTGDNSY